MAVGTRTLVGAEASNTGVRRFDFPELGRVIYGDGAVDQLGDEVRRLGGSRVLLVTSPSLAKQHDLMSRIRTALGDALAAEFHDAVAHVPLASVEAAVESARACKADVVLSFGGGSPVDCAKATAMCAGSELTVAEALAQAKIERGTAGTVGTAHAPLPQISVSTALSAAEYTPTFTVTQPVSKSKVMYYDSRITPATVVLDPGMTVTTPAWLWGASGVRAIDHCVEWFLSTASTPFTDALVLRALGMLWRSLPAVLENPTDLDARLECQLAAWMSVYGSSNVLGGLSHAIGHQLGSSTGMVHGYTSCIVLPHVIEFNGEAVPDRVAELARAAGLDTDDLARGLRELIACLGLPSSISEATDRAADLDAIAAETMREVAIANNPRPVTEAAVRRILELAK